MVTGPRRPQLPPAHSRFRKKQSGDFVFSTGPYREEAVPQSPISQHFEKSDVWARMRAASFRALPLSFINRTSALLEARKGNAPQTKKGIELIKRRTKEFAYELFRLRDHEDVLDFLEHVKFVYVDQNGKLCGTDREKVKGWGVYLISTEKILKGEYKIDYSKYPGKKV